MDAPDIVSIIPCNHFGVDNSSCPSPFQRTIIHGYYDGITAGVTICEKCKTSLIFEVVSSGRCFDNRIFSFTPLVSGSFEAILEAYPDSMKPNWPVWSPKWEVPLTDVFYKTCDTISKYENTVSSPDQVAFLTYSINSIISHRQYPASPFESFEEWVDYLDLKIIPGEDFDELQRK